MSRSDAVEYEIRRTFDAPAAAVFAAWTEAARLKAWMWGSIGADERAESDPRAGGAYRVDTARPDGDRWAVFGEFLEFEPGRRLVCSVRWDAPMGYQSPDERATVELRERGGQTEMLFRHSGIPELARAEHEKGWRDSFDRLATALAS